MARRICATFCSASTSFSRWLRPATLPVLALALGLSLAARPALAQDANDTRSVDCALPRVPDPCVELDGRKSVDPGAGPLTYRWLMGDGTTLTGPVVNHCYARRDKYTVQLDVIVNRTGELRAAEKTIVVDFTKEPLLDFTLSTDTVRVGQAVDFDASRAQNPPCTNEEVAWDFRDGLVAGGRRISHRFRKAGRYEVRMSLRGNGPDSCPDSHCVSRVVVVTE